MSRAASKGRTVVRVVVAAALVAGCGASAAETLVDEPTTTSTTTTTTTTTTTATWDDPAERSAEQGARAVGAVGPVLQADAPDPQVTVVDGEPWLFTTNARGSNVPVVSEGPDGLAVSDALPQLPAWAEEGRTWAPAVQGFGDGWVLTFTARHRSSGLQCIGVATAAEIGGPYVAEPEPLVCELDAGGSIDPSFVSDGDTTWLLWKTDGNCCDLPTEIRSAALTADGLAVAGAATTLIGADLDWEGGLVEAPSMGLVDGRWLLLYSANRWDDEDYAVGAAWCEGPSGPCRKQSEPVLEASDDVAGPGGAEFIDGARRFGSVIAFHAWPPDRVGYEEGSNRTLHLGAVVVDGDVVTIDLIGRRP